MKNILIANIGNRNLSKDGKSLSDLARDQAASFLDYTSSIYAAQSFEGLDVQIISSLIQENLIDKSWHIILVGSSQVGLVGKDGNPINTDQDTLFAAQIMQSILVLDGFDVRVEISNNVVYDTEKLYAFYTKLYKYILDDTEFGKVLICDAGGTPHQKQAMKLTAEFLFLSEQYDVVSVQRDPKGNSRVEQQGMREFRNIMTKFAVEELLDKWEWQAAYTLLKDAQLKEGRNVIFLGSVLLNPSNLNEIKNEWNIISQKHVNFLAQFPFDNSSSHIGFSSQNQFAGIRIVYGLGKAQALLKSGDLYIQEAFMAAFQVAEQIIYAICDQYFGSKFNSTYKKGKNDIEAYIDKNNLRSTIIHNLGLTDGKIYSISLPVLLEVTLLQKHVLSKQHQGLLHPLSTILKGDKYRNDHVHKGIGINPILLKTSLGGLDIVELLELLSKSLNLKPANESFFVKLRQLAISEL